MSLYNILFGTDSNADVYLAMLGLKQADVGRFRDCYPGDNTIIVYTRNGGGNREYYEDVFDTLKEHPNYKKDYDDDFDCTYAFIEFSVPEEHRDLYNELSKGVSLEKVRGTEAFKKLFAIIEREKK